MNKLFREVWTELRISRDDNIDFASHFHDDIEVIYVFRGGGTAHCGGKTYTLEPGSIFTVFPNQVHSYVDCPIGEYILLIIHPSRLLYLENFIRNYLPVSALSVGNPVLAQLLSDALTESRSKSDFSIVEGYLTAFFGKLFQAMQFQNRSGFNDSVSRILQYCTLHYQEPVNAQDLCRELHLSSSQVSRIFTQQLNISFSDYMNLLRLNKAVLLLRNPNLNITQVANRAGFPTIRTFNRVFQKKYGCTPSEYRDRCKNETE
jgi:AraC-like DNA-binding protein